MPYQPTFLPDGRKAYNPRRTERDVYDEWRAHEERERAADPEAPDYAIHLRAREAWRKEEANSERWSEWQKRVWLPTCRAASEAKPDTTLTRDEWAYLAELLNGANHPLAASIQRKAMLTIDATTA